MALRDSAALDGGVHQQFSDFRDDHLELYKFPGDFRDMREKLQAPTSAHAEKLRPMSGQLLAEHGSPIFVVMHAGEIVRVAKSEDEAYDFGETRYRFEDFTVHQLTDRPKQLSGVHRP